jgi:hypothetical protein
MGGEGMSTGSTLEAQQFKALVSVNAEGWFVKKLYEELGRENSYVFQEASSLYDLIRRIASDYKAGRRLGLVIQVDCRKTTNETEKPVVKVLPYNVKEISEVCRESAWVRSFSQGEERKVVQFLADVTENTVSLDEVVKEIIAGEGELKDRLKKLMQKINLNTLVVSLEVPGNDVERCASLIRKIHEHFFAKQSSY